MEIIKKKEREVCFTVIIFKIKQNKMQHLDLELGAKVRVSTSDRNVQRPIKLAVITFKRRFFFRGQVQL